MNEVATAETDFELRLARYRQQQRIRFGAFADDQLVESEALRRMMDDDFLDLKALLA